MKAPLNRVFYLDIEEGVRDWVYRFRNIGINTECSCHHDGYIQCQCVDPTTEIERIKTVFLEWGVDKFTIDVRVNGLNHQYLEIKSPMFKKGKK